MTVMGYAYLLSSSQRSSEDLCRSLGLERITTVDVFHRTRCYGLVLKHKDGWSIVFVVLFVLNLVY
jgi:hypothetical protein